MENNEIIHDGMSTENPELFNELYPLILHVPLGEEIPCPKRDAIRERMQLIADGLAEPEPPSKKKEIVIVKSTTKPIDNNFFDFSEKSDGWDMAEQPESKAEYDPEFEEMLDKFVEDMTSMPVYNPDYDETDDQIDEYWGIPDDETLSTNDNITEEIENGK